MLRHGQETHDPLKTNLPTVEEKKRLRVTQRSMMRRMVGPRRSPNDDYVQWITKSTWATEEKARGAGIRCWVDAFLSAKWRWAGRITNMDADRLASRTTSWRDSAWCDAQSSRPLRTRPGRHVKWEDDLRRYARTVNWPHWQGAALDLPTWIEHEQQFIAWARR